ncbi:MAG: PIN domain-containing protein [Pirellulaceae bacterium]
MRVFLDTNVVCDALFEREPWKDEALAILSLARQQSIAAIVSALTIANVYYIGRKLVGRERSIVTVQTCLATFVVASLDRESVVEALGRSGSDFEDNLQLTLAMRASAEAIVTRDAIGFRGSPLVTWTPSQFLARLKVANP